MSFTSPLISKAAAFFNKPSLIVLARSKPFAPSSKEIFELSGKITSILDIIISSLSIPN